MGFDRWRILNGMATPITMGGITGDLLRWILEVFTQTRASRITRFISRSKAAHMGPLPTSHLA